MEFLKPGSLQHLGENMLAFLLQIGPTSHLPKGNTMKEEEKSGQDTAVFFDILVLLAAETLTSILFLH